MPDIQPIPAVTFDISRSRDISDRIAPPYDVLDEQKKNALLARNEHNIVAIDLPYLPPKTVGPDHVYVEAGQRFRNWLERGVLTRHDDAPAIYVYQQTYTVKGDTFKRRGLIANIPTQPFGPGKDGRGGIHPHEQTFSAAKEDRIKLMRATQAQLSPIFGLYSDPDQRIGALLSRVADAGPATFHGRTEDGVLHEVWQVDQSDDINAIRQASLDRDVFIADGHHRYNTALNYKNELIAQGKDPGKAAHCLFVLVAMQDPGMIVLPTHRVLGNMARYSFDAFVEAAAPMLNIRPFDGNLAELEQALAEETGPHAIGLYDPRHESGPMAIATTKTDDPLAQSFADHSPAWRQLDVALVQHLIVEQLCEPRFCDPGEKVTWRFPHALEQVDRDVRSPGFQLGLVLRPTPLDAVRQVSEAGELMPQKSTFFYPKLATGLVINPLD